MRAYSLGIRDINVEKQETTEPDYKCNHHLIAYWSLPQVLVIPGAIETLGRFTKQVCIDKIIEIS